MSLIPQGYYRARAVRVKDQYGAMVWARWARTKGNKHQVVVVFEVLDHDHEGQRLTWFGFFTEKTWERTMESLRHCGFRGNDLSTINDGNLDREVSIKVVHEQSQTTGRPFPWVAFINEAGGGMIKLNDPMSADEVRHFAAMMKARMAGARAEAAASEPNRPYGPDDDIPF